MALIPIENVGEMGIVKDINPWELPPNVWSEGNNVRTEHGFRVACIHLDHKEDGTYECGIYKMRPRLCKNFNCVEWAKESGNLYQYNQALEKLRLK